MKKVTKRKQLKAVVKAMIDASDPTNETQAEPQKLVLSLEAIQICFAKSKSLEPEHRLNVKEKSYF